MDDALRVGVCEGIADPAGDAESTFRVQRAVLLDGLGQGPRGAVLHDDVVPDDAVFGSLAPRVIDGNDVRVGEAGGRQGLAAESFEECLVFGEMGVQDFDRNRSGQDVVPGLPHRGHASGRDRTFQYVSFRECDRVGRHGGQTIAWAPARSSVPPPNLPWH